jgi:hypothetical protein
MSNGSLRAHQDLSMILADGRIVDSSGPPEISA